MNPEADVRARLRYAEADRRSARNAMAAADYRDLDFYVAESAARLLDQMEQVWKWVLDQLP